jgi:hypothetical protein
MGTGEGRLITFRGYSVCGSSFIPQRGAMGAAVCVCFNVKCSNWVAIFFYVRSSGIWHWRKQDTNGLSFSFFTYFSSRFLQKTKKSIVVCSTVEESSWIILFVAFYVLHRLHRLPTTLRNLMNRCCCGCERGDSTSTRVVGNVDFQKIHTR